MELVETSKTMTLPASQILGSCYDVRQDATRSQIVAVSSGDDYFTVGAGEKISLDCSSAYSYQRMGACVVAPRLRDSRSAFLEARAAEMGVGPEILGTKSLPEASVGAAINYSLFSLSLNDPLSLSAGPEATNVTVEKSLEKFISRFGTHIIAEATFGGQYSESHILKATEFKESEQLTQTLFDSVSSKLAPRPVESSSVVPSIDKVSCVGGSARPLSNKPATREGLRAWISSINHYNAAMISYKLKSIADKCFWEPLDSEKHSQAAIEACRVRLAGALSEYTETGAWEGLRDSVDAGQQFLRENLRTRIRDLNAHMNPPKEKGCCVAGAHIPHNFAVLDAEKTRLMSMTMFLTANTLLSDDETENVLRWAAQYPFAPSAPSNAGSSTSSPEKPLKEAIEAKASFAIASSVNSRILAAAFNLISAWSKPPCSWEIATVAERVVNAAIRRADKSPFAMNAALECLTSILVNYPSKAQQLSDMIASTRMVEVALRLSPSAKIVRNVAVLMRTLSDSLVTGVDFVHHTSQILIHSFEHFGHERTVTAVLDLALTVRDFSVVPHIPQLMSLFSTLSTSGVVIQRVANLLVEHVSAMIVSNDVLTQWVQALIGTLHGLRAVVEAVAPVIDILRSVMVLALSVDSAAWSQFVSILPALASLVPTIKTRADAEKHRSLCTRIVALLYSVNELLSKGEEKLDMFARLSPPVLSKLLLCAVAADVEGSYHRAHNVAQALTDKAVEAPVAALFALELIFFAEQWNSATSHDTIAALAAVCKDKYSELRQEASATALVEQISLHRTTSVPPLRNFREMLTEKKEDQPGFTPAITNSTRTPAFSGMGSPRSVTATGTPRVVSPRQPLSPSLTMDGSSVQAAAHQPLSYQRLGVVQRNETPVAMDEVVMHEDHRPGFVKHNSVESLDQL